RLQEEIDERRVIERILVEREARLHAILRQLPAIVWTVNRDLVFTSSEGSALAQLGLRPGQIVGQALFEYFGTDDPDYPPIRLHRLALHGQPQEYEFQWNERFYRVRLEPLHDRSEEIIGVIGIAFDMTDQVLARQQLERLATTDSLTGLANRTLLVSHLARSSEAGRPFATLLVDLDGFKQVNDTLGHLAGDALLREVATRLQRAVRRGDLVGRLGGDEFVVIASGCDRDSARELAGRLLVALSQPFRIEGKTIMLGASIGIAVCSAGESCEPEELLRQADLALYAAKRRGKGRLAFYHVELSEETARDLALAQALRAAIEGNEIAYRGAPIVHLRSGAVTGFAVSPTWNHPDWGEYRGQALTAVARRVGIDLLLAERALGEALAWVADLPEGYSVVLTVPTEALLDESMRALLRRRIEESPAVGTRLWLNLPTEVLSDPRSASGVQELSAMGIGVLVRDPVLTPEGIQPLVDLPRAGLRIPPGFVRSFLSDPRSTALARALLHVATDLGLITFAEGIDEFGVSIALARSGCTFGLGPLFGGEFDRHTAIEVARSVHHWRQLPRPAPDGRPRSVLEQADNPDTARTRAPHAGIVE
ncbi:MAG: diguanylate cyclase, partial [Thermomicrobium sp.]|nr:diguanylate cyclase [Thermomicrobium sp.]